MKKLLALVAVLASCQLAPAADRIVEGTSFPGVNYEKNFVKNPEAEKNKNLITDAGTIVTRNTVTPLQGVGDFKLDATASGQLVKFNTFTLDKNLKNQNCEAKFVFTGDATLYKAYVEQGATKVTADLPLTNETDSRNISINFPCGDLSANSHLVIESTGAGAAAINVDKVYLGGATNISSGVIVSQWESFVPVATWANVANVGAFRRVGDSMELVVSIKGGTLTFPGGNFEFELPGGKVIDTAKLEVTSTLAAVGSAIGYDSAVTGGYAGTVTAKSSTRLAIMGPNADTTFWTSIFPFAWTGTGVLTLHATVPIAGWGSGALVSTTPTTDKTEWTAYTPTNTMTNSVMTGTWRRIGDSMEVFASLSFSGAPTGAFEVTIPSGYTIDTAKTGAGNVALGSGWARPTNASNIYTGNVVVAGATSVIAFGPNTAGGWESTTTPAAWNSTGVAFIQFRVPITGWKVSNAPAPVLTGSVVTDSTTSAAKICGIEFAAGAVLTSSLGDCAVNASNPATGRYKVDFTTPFASSPYCTCAVGDTSFDTSCALWTVTTTGIEIAVGIGGAASNVVPAHVTCMGIK